MLSYIILLSHNLSGVYEHQYQGRTRMWMRTDVNADIWNNRIVNVALLPTGFSGTTFREIDLKVTVSKQEYSFEILQNVGNFAQAFSCVFKRFNNDTGFGNGAPQINIQHALWYAFGDRITYWSLGDLKAILDT